MEQLKDLLSARSFIALYIACKRFGYSFDEVAYMLTITNDPGAGSTTYSFRGQLIMIETNAPYGKQFHDQNNNLIEP